MNRRVVVVGGGIAGLTALYRIRQQSPETETILLEASPRLGGKILTTTFLGRPIDEAADMFISRVPWGLDLCEELGVEGFLISPSTSSAYVLINGELRKLPEALLLGVPTKMLPLLRSRIVSPLGVLRAGLDRIRPDDWPGDDESVGGLIRRRMGDQIADRLVDPLIGSISAGDTDHLDVALAAPQLETASRRHRSLVTGLKEQARNSPENTKPLFLSFENGMSHLIHVLVKALGDADIRTNTRVTQVRNDGEGLRIVTNEATIESDVVILATPAHQAATLLSGCPSASNRLSSIEHASVALVTMGLRRSDIGHPLDGSGVLVPRTEGLLATAISWGSSKWPHWADDEHVVLRVSAGRAGDTRALALDDDALVEALLTEIGQILDIDGSLIEWRVSRWIDAFPQYAPGHDRLVSAVERDLRSELPGVFLTGAGYRGLGVPACIRQGGECAHTALDYLNSI
ncbi:MAG: protoporphyrinogen oxidase [Actinomycetota bacterium]|nr:protoporphyrinogen oxidase [Actinomycetota bacterium]MEE3187119.1 protoporphyrinogen oxidase [Actinomycetota bacterium]